MPSTLSTLLSRSPANLAWCPAPHQAAARGRQHRRPAAAPARQAQPGQPGPDRQLAASSPAPPPSDAAASAASRAIPRRPPPRHRGELLAAEPPFAPVGQGPLARSRLTAAGLADRLVHLLDLPGQLREPLPLAGFPLRLLHLSPRPQSAVTVCRPPSVSTFHRDPCPRSPGTAHRHTAFRTAHTALTSPAGSHQPRSGRHTAAPAPPPARPAPVITSRLLWKEQTQTRSQPGTITDATG